jgi:DNA primase
MAWVSFEEIKKAVSLEMVIAHYRLELRRVSDASLRGKCPLPMHGSDKSRASFTATLTKGVGGVWACQSRSCIAARGGKRGGNALDFVATMEGCSIRDAAVKLHEWFGVPSAARVGEDPANDKNPETPAKLVSKKKTDTGAEGNKALTLAGFFGDQVPEMAYLGLADAVDATEALLNPVGIPWQVIIHH